MTAANVLGTPQEHGSRFTGDTIYLTVADGNGTMVSLIQSNFHGMCTDMCCMPRPVVKLHAFTVLRIVYYHKALILQVKRKNKETRIY